jgi:hypothetical protein
MEYTKLGRTGLDVSRICLGCMSYGGGNQGNHAWSLGEEESRPFIKRALEAGINFFDTANRYSLGNSEEILGRAQPPQAAAREGERPYWWEQAQGLNSRSGEPLSSTELRRRPYRGPQVCSCFCSC